MRDKLSLEGSEKENTGRVFCPDAVTKKHTPGDSPGGLVVKNPPCNTGFDPWETKILGAFHTPEPVGHNERSHTPHNENPTQRNELILKNLLRKAYC